MFCFIIFSQRVYLSVIFMFVGIVILCDINNVENVFQEICLFCTNAALYKTQYVGSDEQNRATAI